jgi:hypothetical protein
MHPKNRSLVIRCVLVSIVAVSPAVAQDTHIKFYGGAAYVAPLSESDVSVGSVTDAVKAEQHVGWNFGFEGRFNDWLGLEIDYDQANQDVDYGGQSIGTTDFSPLTASLNIHVVHTTIVDFYLGPSYSYVNWGDIEFNQAGALLHQRPGNREPERLGRRARARHRIREALRDHGRPAVPGHEPGALRGTDDRGQPAHRPSRSRDPFLIARKPQGLPRLYDVDMNQI